MDLFWKDMRALVMFVVFAWKLSVSMGTFYLGVNVAPVALDPVDCPPRFRTIPRELQAPARLQGASRFHMGGGMCRCVVDKNLGNLSSPIFFHILGFQILM